MPLKNYIKRYVKERDGNFAIMTGFMMIPVIALFGAATDFAMSSSAQSHSQNIGDAVALNIAAFVRENDSVPTTRDNGGIPPGEYTAKELGFDYSGWVDGGSDAVKVIVEYDMDTNQGIVTVSGQSKTTFAGTLGFDKMGFSSKSVVGFQSKELTDVASVALILDNSGSMAWNDKPHIVHSNGTKTAPTGAVSRISALESSVKDFMSHLDELVGDQSSAEDKVIRTGMLAYNSSNISSRMKRMDWKTLSASTIDAMTAGGGTNPTSSMTTAATWLLGEEAIHKAVNGREPLRYAVFMTDGANNNSGGGWVSETGSGEWRRTKCTRPNSSKWNWTCAYQYRTKKNKPNGFVGYSSNNKKWFTEWTEGRLSLPDDEATLVQCKRMKDDGVKVYTIGFGLEAGTYGRSPTSTSTIDITEDTTTQAYNFLSQCASSSDTFMTASNAEELKKTFDSIGKQIVDEAIRLKR